MPRLGYAPHVTLAVYDALDLARAEAALARFVAGRRAVPVVFAGLGVFPGERSVLWAAPVPDRRLLGLHADLQAALPDCRRDSYQVGRWVPHCTLAIDLRRAALGRALAAVVPQWRPISGRLERLDLLVFDPVEVVRSVPLGG